MQINRKEKITLIASLLIIGVGVVLYLSKGKIMNRMENSPTFSITYKENQSKKLKKEFEKQLNNKEFIKLLDKLSLEKLEILKEILKTPDVLEALNNRDKEYNTDIYYSRDIDYPKAMEILNISKGFQEIEVLSVEMFVGVGASRVRDLFNKARKSAPCIIFIDEIDAVGRKRGSGQGGGNDEREQTLNQLLVEMDGFGTDETIIVLAATNRPEILDKALMRPGRFDRQVVVDNPDIKGREEILKVHARGKKLAKDVDLSVIAKKTPGFVGADLANMLNEAAILAARAGRDEINMADLEEASEKVSIGPERKSKVVIEKERLITAYHEAGHALMHYLLPNTDPVHKITIVPRGMAGGFTMALPEEERSYKFKSEFLDDIRVLFGGRAAEQIVFNDITTGASNDIERATAIAHALVTRFGMTSKFGPMLLDNTKEGDLFQQKYYSDTTGKEVDDEIRGIISEMYAETIKMLQENYDSLDRVAKALLEKETLNREDFEALMRGEDIFKSKESEEVKVETSEEVESEKIEAEKEEIVEKIEEEKNIEEKVEEEK